MTDALVLTLILHPSIGSMVLLVQVCWQVQILVLLLLPLLVILEQSSPLLVMVLLAV